MLKIILLTILLVGSLAFSLLKFERHLLFFFLIRTKHFNNLIDYIGRLWPRLWMFCSDLAVALAFGGTGVAYLTRYNKGSSPYFVLFLLGLPAAIVWSPKLVYAPASVVVLALLCLLLRRLGRQELNFLGGASFLSLLALKTGMHHLIVFFFGLFGVPALLFTGLMLHSFDLIAGKSAIPGVAPLLPGSKDGRIGATFPGFDIFIPWYYGLIALVVTLVSHELAHGVLARVHRVKIKSTGLLTAGFLPLGAFVEPDEEDLKKKSSKQRMHVYAAGSFSNFVVGVVAGVLVLSSLYFMSLSIESYGMKVVELTPGYPAEKVVPLDTVIHGVNGRPVVNYDLFTNVSSQLKPNQTIELNTSAGLLELTTVPSEEDPSRGVVGVLVVEDYMLSGFIGGGLSMKVFFFFVASLGWIAFFNLNIALVNLMPIPPFDGFNMLREVMNTFDVSEQTAEKIIYTVIGLTGLFFLINIAPLLGMLL